MLPLLTEAELLPFASPETPELLGLLAESAWKLLVWPHSLRVLGRRPPELELLGELRQWQVCLSCVFIDSQRKTDWSQPSHASCQDRPQQTGSMVGGVLSPAGGESYPLT